MRVIIKPAWPLAIGVPFAIMLACFLITFTQRFHSNQQFISNAILGDLLITAPLAYLFFIRKSAVSKFTVIRVFVLGVFIAGLILNGGNNAMLAFIKTWLSPMIEVVVIFFVVRKFYKANKQTKLSGIGSIDFLTHCRLVMYEVTGNAKAGNIIASEIAVFYYAFAGKKAGNIDSTSRFTSYKQNGVILILSSILGLFLVETIGAHFLFAIWNKTGAWILTGLSFYTCIQLFAHIRAIKARPIIISENSLEIHNGLAGDAIILFDNIHRFELSNKFPISRQAIKISLLKTLENHNCVVYLKQPIEVTKIFGIKKQADTVLFFVDNLKDFALALDKKLLTS